LGLAGGICLARLLYPEDFGLFAMAAVGYQLAALFDGLGTSQFVITARDPEPNLNAVHRINLALAFGLALVLCVAAPLLALVFHEPRLVAMLAVMSLALPLGAWGAVQRALLERELRLAEIARRRLLVNTGALTLSVLLALAGAGVWALVIPVPVRSAANSYLNRRLHGYRPLWSGAWSGAAEVIAYGKHIMGFRLTRFFSEQMDNAVIGRWLGAASLGIYEFAYQAAMMPLRLAGDIVSRLTLPMLSRQSREGGGEPTTRGLLDAVGWTTYVTLPVVMGLVLIAPDWVLLLYGERWSEAAGLMRWLAPAAFFQLLAYPMVAWMQAAGHEATPKRVQVVFLPGLVVLLALTVSQGLLFVAMAVSAWLIAQSVTLMLVGCAQGAVSVRTLARCVWLAMLPSAIMLAVLIPCLVLPSSIEILVLRLLVTVVMAVALFCLASAMVARPRLYELRDLIRSRGSDG